MKFDTSDFHFNLRRVFGRHLNRTDAESKLTETLEILNNLTDEQQKAVIWYGASRYESGFDMGCDDN